VRRQQLQEENMPDEKPLTFEELRAKAGKEQVVETLEVEKSIIRNFAEAIGDPNPLFNDEEYAKSKGYNSIIAPPGFFQSAVMSSAFTRLRPRMPLGRAVDAGGEWEIYLPVEAGDVLTNTFKFVDAVQEEGKKGMKTFVKFETEHVNQRGELVAKSRSQLLKF
jgi:acyl dehydratase